MGYKTDGQRRAELGARTDLCAQFAGTGLDKAATLTALDHALLLSQVEAKQRELFYVIEEYHEPTNQRRQGWWEPVASIKWADCNLLPGIWDSLPGRKRLVMEDKTVIVTEDFGQKLEIQIS